RHFLLHASYDLEVAENWSVTPFLLGRMTTNSSLFYEVAAQVKYRKQVWLGLTYRKDGSFGGSLGAQVLHRMALNYTFETGSGILSSASASGTHEVSLGFVIGNKANRKGSIFTDYDENASRRPYFKWLRFRKVVY
ncbi:MAG: type IX secretion system membrane protein PorP/SprF, partial [Bacteroidota bacterium]